MHTTTYIATVDTRHFSFMAIGTSEEHAKAALLGGWAVHCQQTTADPEHITAGDINVTELAPGQCARDGTPITAPSGQLPFTEEELCELLSAAAAAFADADEFDRIGHQLDLSDDYMVALREKLTTYLES